MTIIAVLKGSGDVFYIGADSQSTSSEGLKFYQSKLRDTYDRGSALAWGSAGNPQIGITEFGRWIDNFEWTGSETWATFIIKVATEFARLNRIRKDIGVAAGDKVDDVGFIAKHLCQMIICGWLADEGNAYGVTDDGTFQEVDTLGGELVTTGTGSPFAEAVYVTHKNYQETLGLTDEKQFEAIMYLTARYASQCNLPYEYLKMTPEEVVHKRSPEPEPGAEQVGPASQSGTGSNVP